MDTGRLCVSACVDTLQLYVDAQYTELKDTLDILIGTVPLRESFPNLPAPQLNTVITSQPASAPSITDQPDNFDLRMTRLLVFDGRVFVKSGFTTGRFCIFRLHLDKGPLNGLMLLLCCMVKTSLCGGRAAI